MNNRQTRPPKWTAARRKGGKIAIHYQVVESLAVKAKRAKSTTVVFVPLGESTSHRCSWCGQFAKGTPKAWNGCRAMDYSNPASKLSVAGDVCADTECRISTEAKYTKNG
jgi:hypothetical protein